MRHAVTGIASKPYDLPVSGPTPVDVETSFTYVRSPASVTISRSACQLAFMCVRISVDVWRVPGAGSQSARSRMRVSRLSTVLARAIGLLLRLSAENDL